THTSDGRRGGIHNPAMKRPDRRLLRGAGNLHVTGRLGKSRGRERPQGRCRRETTRCLDARTRTILWQRGDAMKMLGAGFAALLLATLLYGHAEAAAASCESLSALKLPNTTITSAQSVGAGAFTPPAATPTAA